MRSFYLALASIVAIALPAHGELIYDFTYTPVSGSVHGFSFSMSSPAFIGPGTPALVPFTITDGSNTVSITQALAGISTGVMLGSTPLPSGDGCLSFGGPTTDLANYQGCGWAIRNDGHSQGALAVDFSGGLPSATGTYSDLIFDGLVQIQPSLTDEFFYNCCGGASGTLQLTITGAPEGTAVPEIDPSSASAALAMLAGALLVVRGRKKAPLNLGN